MPNERRREIPVGPCWRDTRRPKRFRDRHSPEIGIVAKGMGRNGAVFERGTPLSGLPYGLIQALLDAGAREGFAPT
jgi:hypothetical protein